MAVKIKRPDGSEDFPTSKAPLDRDFAEKVRQSFAESSGEIARQAKEVYQERRRNLDSIVDQELRSSVEKKKT